MAVQLNPINQATLSFHSNSIKKFVPLSEEIKDKFIKEQPITEELVNSVENWVGDYLKDNPKRLAHTLSTAKTAEENARIIGYISPLKARLAGLLHDISKTVAKKVVKTATPERLEKIRENMAKHGIDFLESELAICEHKKDKVKNLHAALSTLMAEKKLGITDPEILNAIRYHTVGIKADNLDTLSKIVAIADKIEPVKRGEDLYNQIKEVLVVTKNPDFAITALRGREQQAA